MRFVRTSTILATAGLIGLSACTPLQPGDPGYRTQQGATAGAIIGGLVGASSSSPNKLGTAAVGAAIGAAIGGAIGQQLDKQAGDLRNSISSDQVVIVNTGSELIVTFPQDITFTTDSAVVTDARRSDLAALARNLKSYPDSTVEVLGHTDNVGDAVYNLSLSRRRAAAVAAVLIDNGVPTWRIVAMGMGEDQPVASNLTPEGRAQNRRVEIIIRPSN